jgi:hypothetical protein
MLLSKRKCVTQPEGSVGHDMKHKEVQIQFLQEQEICLLTEASRRVRGSLHPPIQWVLGIMWGVDKSLARQGREKATATQLGIY